MFFLRGIFFFFSLIGFSLCKQLKLERINFERSSSTVTVRGPDNCDEILGKKPSRPQSNKPDDVSYF